MFRTKLNQPCQTLWWDFLMAATRARWAGTLLCQNGGFDNKLLVVALDGKLWVTSVGLEAYLGIS